MEVSHMTNETMMRLKRIYHILFSIVIIIAGICLIAGVLSIYNSGDQPFSRESVAVTFSGIAFPVYLCLVMTIISFVLEFFLPSGKETTPKAKDYKGLLARLYATKDISQADDALRNEILSLQKKRKLHIIIRTILFIIASGVFLAYALNGNNFHQSEINTSMINAMYILTPCLLVSFAYALFVNIHNEKCFEKEMELIKQLPRADKNNDTNNIEETALAAEKKLNLYRSVITIAAVVFIVYGLITGGTIDVLTKAINICTECIGLG